MTSSQRLARVRQCFQAWLDAHSSGDEPITSDWHEAVLIIDGFYRGRRFRIEGTSAVWFQEEDILKIQSDNGSSVARFDATAMDRYLLDAPRTGLLLECRRETAGESATSLRRAA